VDVTQAALRLAAPDETFASVYLEGIAAQAPACELDADVVDEGFFAEVT